MLILLSLLSFAVEMAVSPLATEHLHRVVGEPVRELPSPGATPSFYAITDCYSLSFIRDLYSNIAVIAVIFCRNDRVALG